MPLKTDYKDFIPPIEGIKYKITANADGSSSVDDITQYEQLGDNWAAADANAVTGAVNTLSDMFNVTLSGLTPVSAGDGYTYMGGGYARFGNLVYVSVYMQRAESGTGTLVNVATGLPLPSIITPLSATAGLVPVTAVVSDTGGLNAYLGSGTIPANSNIRFSGFYLAQ